MANDEFALDEARRSRNRDEMKQPQAWYCDHCGYFALAIDHKGKPLPYEVGANGKLVPFHCPRCGDNHTSWTTASPFDDYGDHANLSSAASSRVSRGCSLTFNDIIANPSSNAVAFFPKLMPPPASLSAPHLSEHLLDGLEVPEAVKPFLDAAKRNQQTAARRKPVESYSCGRCGRRLLRMDAKGQLIPLDLDAQGTIIPCRCPGCGALHSDWIRTGAVGEATSVTAMPRLAAAV
jgi:hypothetical protein